MPVARAHIQQTPPSRAKLAYEGQLAPSRGFRSFVQVVLVVTIALEDRMLGFVDRAAVLRARDTGGHLNVAAARAAADHPLVPREPEPEIAAADDAGRRWRRRHDGALDIEAASGK